MVVQMANKRPSQDMPLIITGKMCESLQVNLIKRSDTLKPARPRAQTETETRPEKRSTKGSERANNKQQEQQYLSRRRLPLSQISKGQVGSKRNSSVAFRVLSCELNGRHESSLKRMRSSGAAWCGCLRCYSHCCADSSGQPLNWLSGEEKSLWQKRGGRGRPEIGMRLVNTRLQQLQHKHERPLKRDFQCDEQERLNQYPDHSNRRQSSRFARPMKAHTTSSISEEKEPKRALLSSRTFIWITLTLAILANSVPAANGIDCFKCSSRNGSNPACEDPFHNLNTTRITKPVMPDPAPSVIYHTPCYAGKKGREGLFPASACIKLTGTFARMSHCGKFQFEGDLLRGCVLACPEDACNSAPPRGNLTRVSAALLISALLLVSVCHLATKRNPLCASN